MPPRTALAAVCTARTGSNLSTLSVCRAFQSLMPRFPVIYRFPRHPVMQYAIRLLLPDQSRFNESIKMGAIPICKVFRSIIWLIKSSSELVSRNHRMQIIDWLMFSRACCHKQYMENSFRCTRNRLENVACHHCCATMRHRHKHFL